MSAAALLPGNEDVVAALVARLTANLNDTITALNALPGAPVQLDSVPTANVLDYMPTPGQLISFPMVGLQETDGRIADDVGWGGTGEHGFLAVVFDAHADPQTLARRLRRYRRAVASVLVEGRSVLPAWGISDIRYRPGPTLGRTDGVQEWMSWSAIGFLALSEENAT